MRDPSAGVLCERVDRFAEDPAESRHYGWNRPDLKVHFIAGRHNDDYLVHLSVPRRDQRGGRPARIRPAGRRLLAGLSRQQGGLRRHSRHALEFLRNLDIETSVLSAGRNGAIGTQRFETLREGIQEAEARIFIEKALLGKRIDGAPGRALSDNP